MNERLRKTLFAGLVVVVVAGVAGLCTQTLPAGGPRVVAISLIVLFGGLGVAAIWAEP